jgi:uncharacterized membrane protein YgcG
MERRAAAGAFVFVLAVAAAAVLSGAPARAQSAGERIRAYDVDIRVEPNGQLLVVERIDYDFDGTEHHGIFRDIPVRFPFNDRFDRVYPIHLESVMATGGASAKTKTSTNGGTLEIKIGDANKTVTGRHVYTITYRVDGALNGFSDHDELYWNAIGDEWSVPVDRATVRVVSPAPIQRATCFAGPRGSTTPCAGAEVSGTTAAFSTDELAPYQALTVVVALPRGAVPAPKPILKERWAIQRAFSVTPVTGGVALLLLALLLWVVGRLVWHTGRDRRALGSPVDAAFATATTGRKGQDEQRVPLLEQGATPVEFAPPEGIRPGQVGTLIDESADALDVSATMVDLAVRGYLRIEEIAKHGWFGKPDWRLVRLKDSDGLLEYEQKLLDGLFETPESDEDDPEWAEHETPARPDEPADTAVLTEVDHVRLSALRQHFARRLESVEAALYRDAVKRKWFAGRPDTVRATWHRRGFLLLIGGGALTFLLAWRTHLGLIGIPFVIAGLALTWAARWMPRRTPLGTGMVRRVLGFRTYIDTAEVEEAKFAERANLFSQYLPYAIVFGLTEKWARAFATLGEEEQVPVGTWYVGAHPFSAVALASSIDGFSVTTAGTIAATPASSGGSGFGGGGFSGGGGGGGGGGSW